MSEIGLETSTRMPENDDIARVNKQHWKRLVATNCGFTEAWLNLDRDVLQLVVSGKLILPPEPLNELYPASVLANVNGKEELCLASGGGQQSAVFSLLGACVTVVDLAANQLEGDRRAASHYGYDVTTIQAVLRDHAILYRANIYSPLNL